VALTKNNGVSGSSNALFSGTSSTEIRADRKRAKNSPTLSCCSMMWFSWWQVKAQCGRHETMSWATEKLLEAFKQLCKTHKTLVEGHVKKLRNEFNGQTPGALRSLGTIPTPVQSWIRNLLCGRTNQNFSGALVRTDACLPSVD